MGPSRLRSAWPGVCFLAVCLVMHAGCGDVDDSTGPSVDTAPPEFVSGPEARNVTAHSAEIRWTTDENSTATVYWSADTSAAWQEVPHATLALAHAVAIGGLTTETEYFFAVQAVDAAGNSAERSAAFTFETFSVQPTILIDPWLANVERGDTLTLAIRVLNVEDLFGAAFDLVFSGDAVTLSGDTASAGPFLGSSQSLFLYDGGSGLLESAVSRTHPAGGVDGDGTVAWVYLSAQQTGSATVGFRDGSIALRDPSGALVQDFASLVVVESSIAVQDRATKGRKRTEQ